MSTRTKLIEVALAEVGNQENPMGSNLTKYGEWLKTTNHPKGWNGVAWCMISMAYVYDKAGLSLGTPDYIEKLAWVPSALKIWQPVKTIDPKPGDLVIFNWDKKGEPEHVGMFAAWTIPQVSFLTFEGNIGNRFWPHHRTMEFVDGFFNPKELPA